jgi:hypothetical protein
MILSFRTYTLAINALLENIQLSPVAFKRLGSHHERGTNVVWITKGWKFPVIRPELTIEDMTFRVLHGYKIDNLNISNPKAKFSALTIRSLDTRRTMFEQRKLQIVNETRRLINKERRELDEVDDYNDQLNNLKNNNNLVFTEDDLPSEPDDNEVMIPWEGGLPIDCDRYSDVTDYQTVIKVTSGPDLIFDLQENTIDIDTIDDSIDYATMADVETIISDIDPRYDYNASASNHYSTRYNCNIHNTKIIGFRDNKFYHEGGCRDPPYYHSGIKYQQSAHFLGTAPIVYNNKYNCYVVSSHTNPSLPINNITSSSTSTSTSTSNSVSTNVTTTSISNTTTNITNTSNMTSSTTINNNISTFIPNFNINNTNTSSVISNSSNTSNILVSTSEATITNNIYNVNTDPLMYNTSNNTINSTLNNISTNTRRRLRRNTTISTTETAHDIYERRFNTKRSDTRPSGITLGDGTPVNSNNVPIKTKSKATDTSDMKSKKRI